jgi:hypothetical protein
MCSGNGCGNIKGSTSVTSAPGVAKMAAQYPDLMKAAVGLEGVLPWLKAQGSSLAASAKPYLDSAAPYGDTLAHGLRGAGIGAALGGVGGGLKGLFDEKEEDESRIGHMLGSAGTGMGIGALGGGAVGAATPSIQNLLKDYAPQIRGGIDKVRGGIDKMLPGNADPRSIFGEGKATPADIKNALTRKGTVAGGVVNSLRNAFGGKTASDKLAALAYPALAKFAAGPGVGSAPGIGNSASLGQAPSGAMGSPGAAMGGGAQAQLGSAVNGTMPGGAGPAMPAPPPPGKPMNSGSLGLATAGSGGLKIGK